MFRRYPAAATAAAIPLGRCTPVQHVAQVSEATCHPGGTCRRRDEAVPANDQLRLEVSVQRVVHRHARLENREVTLAGEPHPVRNGREADSDLPVPVTGSRDLRVQHVPQRTSYDPCRPPRPRDHRPGTPARSWRNRCRPYRAALVPHRGCRPAPPTLEPCHALSPGARTGTRPRGRCGGGSARVMRPGPGECSRPCTSAWAGQPRSAWPASRRRFTGPLACPPPIW